MGNLLVIGERFTSSTNSFILTTVTHSASRKPSASQKCKTEARVKNINADAAPELREKKRRMAPLEEDEKKKENKERRKSTSSKSAKQGHG